MYLSTNSRRIRRSTKRAFSLPRTVCVSAFNQMPSLVRSRELSRATVRAGCDHTIILLLTKLEVKKMYSCMCTAPEKTETRPITKNLATTVNPKKANVFFL